MTNKQGLMFRQRNRGVRRALSMSILGAAALLAGTAQAELGCPAGQEPTGAELIANGAFVGLDGWRSGIPVKEANAIPSDNGVATIEGAIQGFGIVDQQPFPGDPANGVEPSSTWLYSNGNGSSDAMRYWIQDVTGLTPGETYVFSGYYSNAIKVGSGLPAKPIISGEVDGAAIFGDLTAEEDAPDNWNRFEATFTATAADIELALVDHNVDNTGGDDLATTALSLKQCAPIGKPGALEVTPATLDFGTLAGGETSPSQVITVTNVGDLDTTVGDVVADLTNFTVISNNCNGVTLAGGENCLIEVAFAPAEGVEGAQSETITIPSNNGDISVTLTGEGAAIPPGEVAMAGVGADGIDFGEVQTETGAVTKQIDIENSGGKPLTGLTVSSSNPALFDITDSTCVDTLAAGEKCQVTVAFEPPEAGVFSATLLVQANEDSATANLKGVGVLTTKDSDNDGLSDEFEKAIGADPLDEDTDDDGLLDGQETGRDGIGTNPLNPDTDGDNLTDGQEAGQGGTGTDPLLRDTDGDGLNDDVEVNGKPTPTDPLKKDTDGDGKIDGIEDANHNGQVDPGETDPRVRETAVAPETGGRVQTDLHGGVGAAGFPMLGLLGLAGWLRRRRVATAVAAAVGGVALVGGPAQAQQGAVYFGLGAGQSLVDPDENGTSYHVDDNTDLGFKVLLGYDLTDRFSVEGYYADLGVADLSGPTNGQIDYTSFGLEGLLYFPHNKRGFSAFAKIGASNVDSSSSNIPFEEVKDAQVSAGLGLEKQFKGGVSLRGEYQFFDTDAQLISLSAIKRFGAPKPPPAPVVEPPPPPPPAPAPEPPKDSDNDGVLDPQDKCPNTPVGTQVDGSGCAIDRDRDGVLNPNDKCPNTAEGVKVDSDGCPLVDHFTGVLEGVNFYTNSDRLTSEAKTILNRVAEDLNRYPSVRVIIVGHTDNRGSAAYNKDLSLRRAKAVARYLVGKGVDPERMRYAGKGEEEPVASNATEEGRAKNRRVEFIAQDG